MGPSSLAIGVVVAGSTAGAGTVSDSEQESRLVKTSDSSSNDLAIAKFTCIAFTLFKVLILNIYFVAHATLID
jgi:preprotein translocase subunit SecG